MPLLNQCKLGVIIAEVGRSDDITSLESCSKG